MDSFTIERNTLHIDGLDGCVTVMQISDSHMSPESSLDSEADRQKAAKQREVWMTHGNGLPQETCFDTLIALGNEQAVDLVAFCGDITDFPSRGTADEARRHMEAAPRYLFAPGNHEQAHRFPVFFEAMTNGDPSFQVMDVGSVRFVAVDNAAHSVPDRVMEKLEAVLYGDKPVVLIQHAPFDHPTLRPDAEKKWDDVTYFMFGSSGDGDNAERYIRLLTKETTQLKAILAGHLHLAHVDTFENGVVQYISAPCLNGYARIIDIKAPCGQATLHKGSCETVAII